MVDQNAAADPVPRRDPPISTEVVPSGLGHYVITAGAMVDLLVHHAEIPL
jgi:hypothetical protein